MTRALQRVIVLGFGTALAAVAALLVLGTTSRKPSPLPSRRLMLLTSLPIVFNEDFSLTGGGSPVLKKLAQAYKVSPISVTSPNELAGGDLLLMAHAGAQTPENLVALDQWIRRGGHLLLLADPLLEWPSKRPLGDPLRPSPMFTDTGLLAHWGLKLSAPVERGIQMRRLGSYRVVTVSPGRLDGECEIRDDGLDARCRIGKGQAIIVADADFLNSSALGPGAEHNLDALLEQLALAAKA